MPNCDFPEKEKRNLPPDQLKKVWRFFYCLPGLFQQYFSKAANVREVSGEEMFFDMKRLKHRNKSLAFKTPYDILL